MNFLFGCCKSDLKGECYEVRTLDPKNKINIKYAPTLNEISKEDYKKATQIMRIKKS